SAVLLAGSKSRLAIVPHRHSAVLLAGSKSRLAIVPHRHSAVLLAGSKSRLAIVPHRHSAVLLAGSKSPLAIGPRRHSAVLLAGSKSRLAIERGLEPDQRAMAGVGLGAPAHAAAIQIPGPHLPRHALVCRSRGELLGMVFARADGPVAVFAAK